MENREKLISDGLLIAGMPLLGYSIAFAYECGYGGYYGIPVQLISVTLTQVLVAIAGLITILYALLAVLYIWYALFFSKKERSPVVGALWSLGPVYLYCLALLLTVGPHWPEWGIALGLAIYFTILVFIPPLITQRDKTTYREKLLADREGPELGISALLRLAVKSHGPAFLWLLKYGSLVFFTVWLAYNSGKGEAVRKTTYFTDSLNSNVVLLRFYGDTVVAHEYDPNTNKLTGDFIVTKLSSKQQLRFQEKRLGHLEKPTP